MFLNFRCRFATLFSNFNLVFLLMLLFDLINDTIRNKTNNKSSFHQFFYFPSFPASGANQFQFQQTLFIVSLWCTVVVNFWLLVHVSTSRNNFETLYFICKKYIFNYVFLKNIRYWQGIFYKISNKKLTLELLLILILSRRFELEQGQEHM